MQSEAARLPGQEARVLEYYQKNPEAMQQLQAPIYEDKVVDFILELATVTDIEATIEDLSKDPEEITKETQGSKKKPTSKKKPKSKAKKRPRAKAADKK